ncbi:MAG: hypothetical protein J6A50_01075 [Clostridia bacterium]|nr:hypothetical protein [Clostridia bacterium]
MDLKKTIDIVCDCAKQYEQNLALKNLFFLYCSDGKYYGLEVVFHNENFLHLTGLNCKTMNAEVFFSACKSKKLSPTEIVQPVKSTVAMKLQVLKILTNIQTTARMLGDFNKNGFMLQTDKIVGNTVGCLGFSLDKKTGFHFPKTALKEDVRKMTYGEIGTIVAILRKPISERFYKEITYIKPDIEISKLPLPAQITSRLDPALFPENVIKRNRNRDCR